MIRILVVDDHTLVRAGICRLFDEDTAMDVVGECGTGREAVHLSEKLKPDVVVLDFNLPDIDGLETTEQITSLRTGARILILTMYESEEYAIRLIRAGAHGFIVKGAPPEELIAAVRKVSEGKTAVTPAIMEKMVDRIGQPQNESPESALSNREIQVLVRLARGYSSREVAEELCLSLSTVETYRSRVLQKLDLRNNADITRFAIRRGLIETE